MAFTYDITTNRGRVRVNLSDTDSTAYVFEAEELDQLRTTEGDVDGATAASLRALLASAARRAKYFAMQGLTLDSKQQVQSLQAALSAYETNAGPSVAVVMGGNIPQDRGFTEPVVG